MSKIFHNITLFKQKKDGRIFAMGNIPLTGFFNSDEYEKEYKILEVNDLDVKQTLLNAAYYLTREENSLTKTQYDLLTLACAKNEIYTRKLSKDECKEVVYSTHKFIHDVLELNEFKMTEDDGSDPKTFKWSDKGKIFVDQTLIKPNA